MEAFHNTKEREWHLVSLIFGEGTWYRPSGERYKYSGGASRRVCGLHSGPGAGRRRAVSIAALNGGGGSGSPFTCPRGSMAAHAAHVLTLTRRPRPDPATRPRLQRVFSHATLFQIRPLNRLAHSVCCFESNQIRRTRAVTSYSAVLISWHLHRDAWFLEKLCLPCDTENTCPLKLLLRDTTYFS